MTTKEPAWKKFLKLKTDVPVVAANIADQSTSLKRKREPLPAQNPNKSILKARASRPVDVAEQKAKANKQKKKAKTKTKRSKKQEAESVAAQESAVAYLIEFTAARDTWKFSKQRQNFLLKHAFDSDAVPETRFDDLVLYIESLQGAARDRCKEAAETLVARHDKEETQEEKEAAAEEEEEEVTQDEYIRAKRIRDALSQ